MKLSNNEEIIGKLTKVESLENNQIKLSLSTQKEIELSANAFSTPKLQSLIDRKIGIINIGGQIFIRKILIR